MLDSCDLVAFVATATPEVARHFYEDTLGLRLVADEPFALVFDARGTELRVTKVGSVTPAPFTVLGWSVPDIHGAMRELAERGVRFERYPGMAQGADGAWLSPAGVKVAWFKDPDGNVLSLSGS